MKLKPFRYHLPDKLDDALSLLESKSEDAALYAGGTELLLLMKLRMAEYSDIVGLRRIPGLQRIERQGCVLSIGAMATHACIAGNPEVRENCPALAQLCGSIGNPRVREAGTLGGNLCFAEPRADPPVLLAALGAEVVLHSAQGARSVPADDFIVAPLETVCKPNEVLTEIRVPLDADGAVCVRVEQANHSLATAALTSSPQPRLRLGYGAGVPLALPRTEDYLASTMPNPDFAQLSELIKFEIAEVEVVDDADAGEIYRRNLMLVAVQRAVRQAIGASGTDNV